LQHGLSAAQAADTYILLAVGDALVAQIPGLLISVAAAMVVSRVGKDHDLGRQIVTQMFISPRVLGIAAGILFVLGVIPGMPHLVFLSDRRAGLYRLGAGAPAAGGRTRAIGQRRRAVNDGEASWDDLQPVDQLGLELGYRLIALVDKNRQGDLLNRIKGVRRKFAQEVGFLPPAVHVRDNLELKPSGYRITLRGVIVGEGEAFPGMFLAINPGGITTPLIGTATTDPAFGLPAHWIDDRKRKRRKWPGLPSLIQRP
jgi:flagellar biosynthesis protein FlhA